MRVIADLQIHSRFSRAVSSQMTLPIISDWSLKKGVDLVATGDWTHPMWFREIKSQLKEVSQGIFKLKTSPTSVNFLLSTEISSIYSQSDKVRRIHTLIFAPSIAVVEKINKELTVRRCNLLSDGRPIVGLSAHQLAQLVLDIDDTCLVIPAHAWTPWFSVFGSRSGFDSLAECFGDLAHSIYAIETGLSSDPTMNWQVADLAHRSIVSFSDAHSPSKIGREATLFNLSALTYDNITKAIIGKHNSERIQATIEFFPEEGKYHLSGHRNCKVVYTPNEEKQKGKVCPVCGKDLTIGVLSRVGELAKVQTQVSRKLDKHLTTWFYDKNNPTRPEYTLTVPLIEILESLLASSKASKKVTNFYDFLIKHLGSEFEILLFLPLGEIDKVGGRDLANAIKKVRSGDLTIKPGYDGVFGVVKLGNNEIKTQSSQKRLF